MGLLHRWDRKNQRALECHNELDCRQGRLDSKYRVLMVGLLLGTVLAGFVRVLLADAFGVRIAPVAVGVLAATALLLAGLSARQQRREREAGDT